jgi:hypothetical protein
LKQHKTYVRIQWEMRCVTFPQFQRRNLIAEARWWTVLRVRVPQAHWQPVLRVQVPQAHWQPALRVQVPQAHWQPALRVQVPQAHWQPGLRVRVLQARWWQTLPAACPSLPAFCNPSTVPHQPIQIPLLRITFSSYLVNFF